MSITTAAAKIRQLRKEKGLTQDELAKLLGVTNQAVSKWENGLSYPDVALLTKLAEVLGISIDSLLDDNSEIVREAAPEPPEARSVSEAPSLLEENTPEKVARYIWKLGRNFGIIAVATIALTMLLSSAGIQINGSFYDNFLLYMVYAVAMALLFLPQCKSTKYGLLLIIAIKLIPTGLGLLYSRFLYPYQLGFTSEMISFLLDPPFWSIFLTWVLFAKRKDASLGINTNSQ